MFNLFLKKKKSIVFTKTLYDHVFFVHKHTQFKRNIKYGKSKPIKQYTCFKHAHKSKRCNSYAIYDRFSVIAHAIPMEQIVCSFSMSFLSQFVALTSCRPSKWQLEFKFSVVTL